MAGTTITPTRMVLNQLKGRLKTARRGHKLLKDKRDELMRQFMDVVKLNKQLRTRVEEGLTEAFASLQVASSIMSPEMLEQALLYPRQSVELDMKFKNIMSVNVPLYSFTTKNNDPSEIYPYGFAQTSGELDDALEHMAKVFEDMLELAQVEKTMQLLAEEIEKTRRRVNALEYVMIPDLEKNIKDDPRSGEEHQVHHHEAGGERELHQGAPAQGQGNGAAGRPQFQIVAKQAKNPGCESSRDFTLQTKPHSCHGFAKRRIFKTSIYDRKKILRHFVPQNDRTILCQTDFVDALRLPRKRQPFSFPVYISSLTRQK